MGGRGAKSPIPESLIGKALVSRTADNIIEYDMANPLYYEGGGFHRNCQRCFVAYELLRRGYNVEARPKAADEVDPLYNGRAWWTDAFIGMDEAEERAYTTRGLVKKMKGYGDKSRAAIKITWKREPGEEEISHVFMAEYDNGRVRYFDPQTNHLVDVDYYLGLSQRTKTRIYRIDNLKINHDVIDFFVRRKRK